MMTPIKTAYTAAPIATLKRLPMLTNAQGFEPVGEELLRKKWCSGRPNDAVPNPIIRFAGGFQMD
jgi:hypothetical protein